MKTKYLQKYKFEIWKTWDGCVVMDRENDGWVVFKVNFYKSPLKDIKIAVSKILQIYGCVKDPKYLIRCWVSGNDLINYKFVFV